jgi:hypothetical protein
MKNLFVIYPPGLGGNHLANMLSLSDDYITRFDLEKYDNVPGREIKAHHFSFVKQFDVDTISKNLEQLSNQNNVFAGHWLAYHTFKKSGLVEKFPNRKFLSIQIPEQNTKAFVRLQKLGIGFNNYPWLLHEIGLLYKVDCLSLVCEEPIKNWCYVWTDMLFGQNFSVVIKDLENQGLELNLDLDLAQSFHNKWLNNLEKEVSR